MKRKRKRIKLPENMLNIALAAIIIIIIVAAALYMIVTSPVESIETVSPEEVMDNIDTYIGKTISVDGYFYYTAADEGFITSTITDTGTSSVYDPLVKRLPVNIEQLNTTLSDSVKYRFTGVIKEVSDLGTAVILYAEEFKEI